MLLKSIPKDWQATITAADRTGWLPFFDWLEEQNDTQRLAGYRALYAGGKKPLHWLNGIGEASSAPPALRLGKSGGQVWLLEYFPDHFAPSRLPHPWLRCLTGADISEPGWVQFGDLFRALDAAARAYPIPAD